MKEDHLLLLAFQQHPNGRLILGRPKKKTGKSKNIFKIKRKSSYSI